MNKMIKRRKDEGFTLIELMIVIAVIGILAVVLVPRIGGVKTQARMAGVDVNIRTVQAYVESRIETWSLDTTTFDQDGVAAEIEGALTDMVNPIDNTTANAFDTDADIDDVSNGAVFVSGVTGSGTSYAVTIEARNANGATVYKTVTVNNS